MILAMARLHFERFKIKIIDIEMFYSEYITFLAILNKNNFYFEKETFLCKSVNIKSIYFRLFTDAVLFSIHKRQTNKTPRFANIFGWHDLSSVLWEGDSLFFYPTSLLNIHLGPTCRIARSHVRATDGSKRATSDFSSMTPFSDCLKRK